MKKITKILIWIFVAEVMFISLMTGLEYVSRETYVANAEPQEIVTHAQKTWIAALEWCESKGVPTAVNPKDRDGTASYYSFQFKPGTFKYYGERYEIISSDLTQSELMESMKDQGTQQKILENMVADQKHIVWEQQFPDCVKRKIGRPPVY